jgi:hypothetical protein
MEKGKENNQEKVMEKLKARAKTEKQTTLEKTGVSIREKAVARWFVLDEFREVETRRAITVDGLSQ